MYAPCTHCMRWRFLSIFAVCVVVRNNLVYFLSMSIFVVCGGVALKDKLAAYDGVFAVCGGG